jgi:arginase family enzyme
VAELLKGIAGRGALVGVDLFEVAPDYDHTGATHHAGYEFGYVFVERKRQNEPRRGVEAE